MTILNNDKDKIGWVKFGSQLTLWKEITYFVQRLFSFDWIVNFYVGVRNIIRWIPILYKDRDWDYYYLLSVMRFKMCNINNYLKKHQSFEGVEVEIERIDRVVAALDRLINDQYDDQCLESVYKKYGERTMYIKKIDDEHSQLDFLYENVKTEQQAADYNREFKQALEQAEVMRKNDAKIVFRTIEKYGRNWWD